jgi:hypothetical protein
LCIASRSVSPFPSPFPLPKWTYWLCTSQHHWVLAAVQTIRGRRLMFSMRLCMAGSLASLSQPLFRRIPRHFCFKIRSSFSSFGTRVIGLLNASSGVALEVLYCSTVLHFFYITPHFFFLCGHVDRREVLDLCYPRYHHGVHSTTHLRPATLLVLWTSPNNYCRIYLSHSTWSYRGKSPTNTWRFRKDDHLEKWRQINKLRLVIFMLPDTT